MFHLLRRGLQYENNLQFYVRVQIKNIYNYIHTIRGLDIETLKKNYFYDLQ